MPSAVFARRHRQRYQGLVKALCLLHDGLSEGMRAKTPRRKTPRGTGSEVVCYPSECYPAVMRAVDALSRQPDVQSPQGESLRSRKSC